MLVYSEFGRRVAGPTPATAPTTAPPARCSCSAAAVRGGFHGAEPSLTDLDDGDLKHTTDFRAVYATVLDGVLGADPGRVLDGWSERVDGLLA